MKYMIFALFAMISLAPATFAQNVGTPENFFAMFNIDVTMYLIMSAVVLFLVEAFKTKLNGLFPGLIVGWKVSALTILIGFSIALKAVYPDWSQVVILTISFWLLPTGMKTLINKTAKKVGGNE